MKLADDNDSLVQNKLLILYILNKIDKPLNSDELLKLVLSITNMNYFYFQQFLLDLLEHKYITNFNDDYNSLYIITDEGKQTLDLTKNMIPGILQLKVDNQFKDSLSRVKDEFSIVAEFIPENEREYSVRLKFVENNKNIFDLGMFAGSREQAKNMVENWEKNANDLYPKIFQLLINKNE